MEISGSSARRSASGSKALCVVPTLPRVSAAVDTTFPSCCAQPAGYTTGFTINVASSMLGESFHVDTVAHLLRPMVNQMPAVPVVLSLFDGIGAAKLALKRCGVGRCVYIARPPPRPPADARTQMLAQGPGR